MLGNTYEHETCRAARALEVAGERWSLLILRNAAFANMTRFTDFQQSLKLAPNVLTRRLERFVDAGLMTTAKGGSEHLEYTLTPKGRAFIPVIIALTEWGNQWDAPHGPPIEYRHAECDGEVRQQLVCKACHKKIKDDAVMAKKTKAMVTYQAEMKKRSG